MKLLEKEKNKLGKYSVSPYNFVSFPEKTVVRYKSLDELPKHNNFKDKLENNLLKGHIDYEIKAETPIIISKGKDKSKNIKFFRDLSGDYAIPGSTIRGLIRTNSQILSFSDVVGDKDKNGQYPNSEIEDSRFLYRDIASDNALKFQYKNVLGINGKDGIARNLKAGYIKNQGGEYFIYPSIDMKMDNPYFKINEIKLRKIAKKVKDIQFMYTEDLLDKEEEIKSFNKGKKISRRNKLLEDCENKGFEPYQIEISFNYDSKKRIINIGQIGEYINKGYLLTSNHINGKMAHYIIPEENKNISRIKVFKSSIEAYIDDMIKTKKTKNENGNITVDPKYEFYDLPKKGQKKPVFYIQLDNELHFGFTPFIRIIYGKSVLDGIPKYYNDFKGISYTDSIFGFTNKKEDKFKDSYSYKSRVSFEDAKVVGNGIIDSDSTVDILLAEPKPTSFNLYLKQDLNSNKKNLNLYENNFRIRGFKQYWLKDYIEIEQGDKNSNMTSKIYPLKEGANFKGRIYFENLEEDELGLLLWSLKLNDDSYQNIGLAKSCGFGRVKIEDIKLNLEDLDKKYSSFSFDYFKEEDIDTFIDIYKSKFSKEKLNGEDIEQTRPVRELMKIKSKIVKKEDRKYYRYMELREFKQKKVLPEILEYEKIIKIPEDNYGGKSRYNGSNNGKDKSNRDNNQRNKKNKSRQKHQEKFGTNIDLSSWYKNDK